MRTVLNSFLHFPLAFSTTLEFKVPFQSFELPIDLFIISIEYSQYESPLARQARWLALVFLPILLLEGVRYAWLLSRVKPHVKMNQFGIYYIHLVSNNK